MLERRYITFILIACLCAYSLYAHNPFTTLEHTAFSKFLEGTSAKLTCNFEGRTFTRTHYYYSDGYYHSTTWYPSLTTPYIEIKSKGHGLGFAQVKLYGNIDGNSVGNTDDWSPAIDVGWYVPGVPFASYGHDVDVSASHSGTSTTSEGTHNWDGSGTIQYTPYYYKVRVALPESISGTWENGATWSTSDSKPDGSWTIKYNTEMLSYPKYPGGNGGGTGGNGDNPPTGSTPPPSNSDIQYACGDHSGPSSGSSGHTAASCGTSGHYICDSTDHSLQASCTSTDSNSNYCTVTSFYACDGHSHLYPPPLVECGYSSCSEMVSSRTSHRATCGSGSHTYWPGCPNNTSGWHQHSTHVLKTCGRSACRQTWRSCQSSTPTCLANSRKKCVAG